MQDLACQLYKTILMTGCWLSLYFCLQFCLSWSVPAFFPSSLLKPRAASSSQPLWLTTVMTRCANWKRPWLVLFTDRSGWCPAVFPSADSWQLAFRLRRSAAWTLASLCRPLASHSLSANTRPGPKPHGVGGNCRLASFFPAVWLLSVEGTVLVELF